MVEDVRVRRLRVGRKKLSEVSGVHILWTIQWDTVTCENSGCRGRQKNVLQRAQRTTVRMMIDRVRQKQNYVG